jgi:hypothetical protein
MGEFMNEEMKGKKRSSKEKTATIIKRTKKKKVKKETRSANEACRPNGISPEDSCAMKQKTQQD